MNRQTFFVLCSAAVVLCGCESSKVKISGRFVGTEARKVYLEEASPLRQTIVDSTLPFPIERCVGYARAL